MLRSVTELEEYTIDARDGTVGERDDEGRLLPVSITKDRVRNSPR
jgi:hypothetical protein